MKKYRVEIAETNYGFVEVELADNASEEEVIIAAQEATEEGKAFFSDSDVQVFNIHKED